MADKQRMASLAVVNYEALARHNTEEIYKMAQASRTVGMFYLDLKESQISQVLQDVPKIYDLSKAFFELPSESREKVDSLCEGQERGYHVGKGFEYYEIPRDELRQDKWQLPATFEPNHALFARTMALFGAAADLVVRTLADFARIDVPEAADDMPEDAGEVTAASDTALKLLYKPPIHEAGALVHGEHTDFGLATLLWYDEVTTQIPVYDDQGKKTDEWQTVPVVEGALLVNVADELEKRSKGRLHSTLHRVVAPPGPKRVRNGMIYLARPYKT